MKLASTLSSALLLGLCANALNAEVVFKSVPGGLDAPWEASYAEGSLVASTVPEGPGGAIAAEIGSGNYFAQSIVGNGQVLKGFAFYGVNAAAAAAEYTLTVFDYGKAGVLDTRKKFNPKSPATIVVNVNFTLQATKPGRLFFQFSGDESIQLKRENSYVFMIAPTSSSGKAKFYRLTNGTAYADGACAAGPLDLNPHAFSANGETRDAVFSLYTAAK
jgi:hypothetical protein